MRIIICSLHLTDTNNISLFCVCVKTDTSFLNIYHIISIILIWDNKIGILYIFPTLPCRPQSTKTGIK